MLRRLAIILGSLLLLVVVAAGGLLALLTFTPDTFKPLIERVASSQLGREVRIEGPIRIDPGAVTMVEIEGLRVAAPDWAEADNLAEVQRIRVGLDLGSLVTGRPLHLTEVTLDGPRVALERDTQGRTSWPSGESATPEEAAPQDEETDEPGSALPRIDRLTLTDGHIAYDDAVADVQLAADLATRSPEGSGVPVLVLDGNGVLRGEPIDVTARAGLPVVAGAQAGPLPIELQATLPGAVVTINGQAREPQSLTRIELTADVRSQDLRPLLALAGRPVEAELPPLEARARLIRPESAFELSDLAVSLGESRVEGQLSYEPGAPARVRGQLRAPRLDLVPIWPALTAGEEEEPTGENPLAALAGFDVDVTLETGEVLLPQATLRQAQARVVVANDRLTVEPLRVTLPAGDVAGRVASGPFQEPFSVELAIDARDVNLAEAVRIDGQEVAGLVNGSLSGTLRGTEAMAILRESQLRFEGRVEGLRVPQADLGTVATTIEIENGRVVADPLRANLPQGQVSGRVAAGPFGQGFTADIDLTAEGVDLNAIARGDTVAGALNARAQGTLQGSTPSELLTRSRLEVNGTIDGLRLPQVGDRIPAVTLMATIDPERPTAFRMVAEARGSDLPLRLAAWGGSAERLLANEGDYPVTLELDAGNNRGRVNGTVALPLAAASAARADVTLEGEQIGPVLSLLGLPGMELPPYRFATAVTRDGDTVRIVGLDGRVGESDIGGDLAIALGGERPAVTGELRSRLIALNDFTGLTGARPNADPAQTARAEVEEAAQDDGQVLPDEPLEPSRWRRVDLDLDLAAEQLRASNIPLDGFHALVRLDDGHLRVDPLEVRVAQGRIDGQVELDGRRSPVRAELNLDLRRLSMARLLNRLDIEVGALGTLSGQARGGVGIGGTGFSVAQILGNADGETTLVMEGGAVDRTLAAAAGFDLLGVLGSVLGITSEQVELRCTLADLAVRDGVVTTRSLLVDTPLAIIRGDGTINLETEQIDLTFFTRPKRTVTVPIERTGVSIGGTLADPQVQLNPAELALRGATAATLGVLARPFGALVDALGGGQDQQAAQARPCLEALAEAGSE